MQITAKLTQLLPIQTGSGKNGEWKKEDILVEIDAQYPKKIFISIWVDKINEGQLQIGNFLKIDFDIESKEYNSKWYTDVKAWKIEVETLGIQKNSDAIANINIAKPQSDDDILPF